MKWTYKILATTSLLFVFSLVAYAEPLIVRFSHDGAAGDPKTSVAMRFKELVKKRIGDKAVVVKIESGSERYNDDNALNSILKGSTDITMSPISSFKKYSPRFHVFELPFVFASSVAAQKFVQGDFSARLLNTLKPNGLHGFGYLNDGMRQLSSNKLIVTPDDLKGLKIHINGSAVKKVWLYSIGAFPVKKPQSKVYAALKSGELDGQMNGWSNVYAHKLFEQQGFIFESDHSFLGYVVMASEEFWQKIPNDLQSKLSKAMSESIDYGNVVADKKAKTERQLIIDAGKAKVYKLTVDQRQAWTEAMLPTWKKFESEIGEGLIQAAASQR